MTAPMRHAARNSRVSVRGSARSALKKVHWTFFRARLTPPGRTLCRSHIPHSRSAVAGTINRPASAAARVPPRSDAALCPA